MYFNDTYCNYPLSDSRDNDDIFKVKGSNVKVTDPFFQKFTFPADRLIDGSLSHTVWFQSLKFLIGN